ncbi:MAG: aminopeptidase P N-terminal domain-containing protein [Polyangiaceae bacterium]|nr:aminopeptidase P N-terminal domain-containing protein [Polyangiaceae bacterium]
MNAQIFRERRRRVLEAMGSGVLVIPAAPVAIRNHDVEHEYRQDSDFYYLTGFEEPESVLVLSSEAPEAMTLFLRERDPEREVWDGARAGLEGARETYGADRAFAIGQLDEELPRLFEVDRVFYAFGRDPQFEARFFAALGAARRRAKTGARFPTEIIDPGKVLHRLRLLKSGEELQLMTRAIDITREAHVRAMAEAAPGKYEYEIDAVLSQVFRRRGSPRPAYGSIVGSGPNATVLHYRSNNRQMQDGELLLIDAGCEYEYYASDITRTFPVNGSFSEPQRAIYEVVLEAQLASIRAVRPGATLDDVHRASVEVITRGLVQLGLIEGPVSEAIEELRYRPYYMHKTSHYLGMDVHDVGPYFEGGKPRPLQAGVVITVEPGIYIAEESAAPEAYRGIGVRIEDDVLVTDQGHRVLSAAIPKTVADVEAACRGELG